MKLLRAAGLPDGAKVMFLGASFRARVCHFSANEPYRLPADHAAYTLLEAGWLDGRNVALWFGGENAPDDWLKTSNSVLFRAGNIPVEVLDWTWEHFGGEADIIAYIRKAEYRKETVNACQSFDETVTIAKMTPTEIKARYPKGVQPLVVLQTLGLIKPEPTRLERFWATRDTKDVYGPPCKAFQLIEEALNFEK